MNVREELFSNSDEKYKSFHLSLLPGFSADKLIGVRIPILRRIAKNLENDDFAWEYYEEVMLHGFYIGYAKLGFDERLSLLERFIPKIDNWAVCDCVCSTLKFIKNSRNDFLPFLGRYMYSKSEYEKRFAIVIIMDYYLDDEYRDFAIDYLKNIESDKYYVNMAAAWALSAAFVKFPDKVTPLIENGVLRGDIHNMTVSKICDSLRVDKKTKEYLKKFKR